jgi:predicted O-methyltransferase YrrM
LDPEISNERFDCVVLSLSEWDWLKRLDLAWRILEPGGLLIITDTLNIDDESSQVLKDFMSTRSAAVVGFKIAEGMIAAFKPETESLDRILDDSDIIGPQAAGILADLTGKKRTPGIRLLAIPPEAGRLLWILARITESRRILEIGSGGGYSGIWLSSALEMINGHLVTVEIDPVKTKIAKASYRDSGLSNRIELIEGDAFDVLPTLHGPFDMVFLDSEKSDYVELLDLILPLLRNDGLLIADNVISHAEELKLYVDTVQHLDNLASVTAVIGSGEEITLKL